jgi:tol-pal system protein YbgF
MVAAILVALTIPGPVLAQSSDLRPLYDRLERLQRDVDVLQRQLARPGAPAPAGGGSAAPPPGVSADFIGGIDDRFSAVNEQIRELTGRIEQLTHSIGEVSSRLDKLVTDVDFRLTALEKGAPPAQQSSEAAPSATQSATPPQGQQRMVLVPGTPSQQAAATPTVTLPQGSPEAQYEFAYGILTQAQREQTDFARAEAAWRAFLAANPNHRYAGNAQYWLGETYYARRDYQNAVATFAEGLQKYPRSDKAPDNLLKLGMSLGQLNRKNEACGTLVEIDKRFPNAAAQIKQTAQRERARLGCS